MAHEGVLPMERSFFELKGQATFSTLKMAHGSDSDIILRLWNRRAKETTTEIVVPKELKKAVAVNLAETGSEPLKVSAGVVKTELRGHEISTVKLLS